MLGSQRNEYSSDRPRSAELFSVKLPGSTLWGWVERSADGRPLVQSDRLFADFPACLCDAERRDAPR